MNRQNLTFTLLATSLVGLTLGIDRADAFNVKFTKIANINDSFTNNQNQTLCVSTGAGDNIVYKDLTTPAINGQNISFGFSCGRQSAGDPRRMTYTTNYYFTASPNRKFLGEAMISNTSISQNAPAVKGGNTIFVGQLSQLSLAQNGTITALATSQTPFFQNIAPQTDFAEVTYIYRGPNVQGYFPPAVSGNRSVLFFAASRNKFVGGFDPLPELVRGLYLRNSQGEFRPIAQTGPQAQANKNFGNITKAFDVTDSFAVFATDKGVYVDRSGQTTAAVDLSKLQPFGYQSVSRYCGVSADGARFAVCVAGKSASDPLATGIYIGQNGNLREVVKNGATTPAGITVDQIDQVAIDSNNVAFVDRKRSPSFTTLYISANGKLNVIASAGARGGGTQIDGKTVQSLSIGRQAIDGNSIVFNVSFSDTDKAIYRADFTP
jgi:hypothetical protein